jgi:hypothetical protein
MATRVVVERICDQCGRVADTEDDVTSLLISVGKAEYEVDLCTMCLSGTRVLENARKVKPERAAKHRRNDPVLPPEPVVEGWPCPHEGCDFVASAPNGLGPHSRKHRVKS